MQVATTTQHVGYVGLTEEEAISQIGAQWGGYVGFPWLKRLYEKYLSRANELEEPVDYEEEAERGLTLEYCLRVFMLFFVGCTILYDKSNKHIKVMWLEGVQNFGRVHEWSWGGMRLPNLYHHLPTLERAPSADICLYLRQ